MSALIDAAILARLREITTLLVVEGGDAVPGRPERYCVVWSNSGARSSDRLDGSQGNIHKRYIIHSIGQSRAQASWVNERVMAKLIDFKPAVEGWSFQRLKHTVSRPVEIDRDVKPHLAFMVDQFDLYAFPGPRE